MVYVVCVEARRKSFEYLVPLFLDESLLLIRLANFLSHFLILIADPFENCGTSLRFEVIVLHNRGFQVGLSLFKLEDPLFNIFVMIDRVDFHQPVVLMSDDEAFEEFLGVVVDVVAGK